MPFFIYVSTNFLIFFLFFFCYRSETTSTRITGSACGHHQRTGKNEKHVNNPAQDQQRLPDRGEPKKTEVDNIALVTVNAPRVQDLVGLQNKAAKINGRLSLRGTVRSICQVPLQRGRTSLSECYTN